ncbi:hypothetical protein AOC05_03115 [Arthrobacter alpinus]|uniref:Uncharacterized protein n=1 Tax=Arthrobacter alpinus TaxID=656366 RepID=A0A0M4QEA9_9MICC|nr:hypothetical protein AOC05_03115 [Arthrobacter alpinus]
MSSVIALVEILVVLVGGVLCAGGAVVVGVAAFVLGGVHVVAGGVEGDALVEADGPVALVCEGVVGAAEWCGVVDVVFPAFVPGDDVVGFGPGSGFGAVGEGAAEVAGEQDFALCGGEEALGAADVEDLAAVAEDGAGDVGVAEGFGEGC